MIPARIINQVIQRSARFPLHHLHSGCDLRCACDVEGNDGYVWEFEEGGGFGGVAERSEHAVSAGVESEGEGAADSAVAAAGDENGAGCGHGGVEWSVGEEVLGGQLEGIISLRDKKTDGEDPKAMMSA